jgi:lysophospholipase L1-like esterase
MADRKFYHIGLRLTVAYREDLVQPIGFETCGFPQRIDTLLVSTLMRRMFASAASLLLSVLCLAFPQVSAGQSAVTPGARVAIIGDSITEQRQYSKYVEAYLLACSGVPDVKVFQFGWSGETAGGFSGRLENDLGVFKPTVATLCYGMNDGGYQPWKEAIGANYDANMRKVIKGLEAVGVKSIVVGSPGAVDDNFFRPGTMMGDQPSHVAYNDTLAHLRDIDRKLAEEYKQRFADVHQPMIDAMRKAQKELGPKYPVCGGDGFHPGPNGQLIMAYAFLKGLNVDGKIGEVTVDLKASTTASPGHKVVGGEGGKVELESTRWPFCFEGDAKSPNGTRSITRFLPFNEELNRFTLKVVNLDAPKARVTWGAKSLEFTKEQLTGGVNLAAEFDVTPFDGPFKQLVDSIGVKQAFETYMIKQVVTNFRSLPADLKSDAELQKAVATIKDRLGARQEQFDAEARKLLVPVKHILAVEPLK